METDERTWQKEVTLASKISLFCLNCIVIGSILKPSNRAKNKVSSWSKNLSIKRLLLQKVTLIMKQSWLKSTDVQSKNPSLDVHIKSRAYNCSHTITWFLVISLLIPCLAFIQLVKDFKSNQHTARDWNEKKSLSFKIPRAHKARKKTKLGLEAFFLFDSLS